MVWFPVSVSWFSSSLGSLSYTITYTHQLNSFSKTVILYAYIKLNECAHKLDMAVQASCSLGPRTDGESRLYRPQMQDLPDEIWLSSMSSARPAIRAEGGGGGRRFGLIILWILYMVLYCKWVLSFSCVNVLRGKYMCFFFVWSKFCIFRHTCR